MNPRELLAAYAAGEMEGEERERMEVALADSPALRDELRRYERLFTLLSAAAAEEVRVPEGFHSRVNRQVALRAYLSAAASAMEGLLGGYGRAIIYYLGLA